MPLCTLALLSLDGGHAAIDTVLSALNPASAGSTPPILTAAHVHRPIIRATRIDAADLNDTEWHLLLIFSGGDAASALERIKAHVRSSYVVGAGVPSRLVDQYQRRTADLANRPTPTLSSDRVPTSLPPSTRAGSDGRPTDSQHLEVSDALLAFADRLEDQRAFEGKPVVMLNLLHFEPGMKSSYEEHGKAFASVGARHGGDAKLVGAVVGYQMDLRARAAGSASAWWNEVAYAQYPTIRHFINMAADPAYQDINQRFRLPALRDTTILCTTEVDRSRYESHSKM